MFFHFLTFWNYAARQISARIFSGAKLYSVDSPSYHPSLCGRLFSANTDTNIIVSAIGFIMTVAAVLIGSWRAYKYNRRLEGKKYKFELKRQILS